MTRALGAARWAAVLLAATLASGCGDATDPAPAPAAPGSTVSGPDEGPDDPDGAQPLFALRLDRTDPSFSSSGSAEVTVSVATLDGGTVSVVDGRDGLPALDFPAYTDQKVYPRAALRVEPTGAGDQLSPGSRDFAWGADFELDRTSLGSGVDNGDNLIQRGLSSQPSLFKAELDHDRAACTVRGDQGELIVRADGHVTPGRWYQIRCERTGDRLTVEVTEYGAVGPLETSEKSVEGPVGAVSYPDPTIPLAIGGKLGSDGELVRSATDQFNGLVMNPFVTLLG